MCYWQALSGNIAFTMKPFFDYYLTFMDDFRENAKKLYGFCQGNYIFYEIPLSALSVSVGTEIQFKITDNISQFLNIDAFYTSGEAAPIGRLNFAYKIA